MQVDRSRGFPLLRFRDRESYAGNRTKEYDDLAMRYLSYLLYPLVGCFAVYSLMYERHKSWYSWILGSLTSCVYTFGRSTLSTLTLFSKISQSVWRIQHYWSHARLTSLLHIVKDVIAVYLWSHVAQSFWSCSDGSRRLCAGFIMMCPQLFINYKLKSVAHMPWRQMTYKFLNTIIDDLFAFVIKMPLLHRLSVFRDGTVSFLRSTLLCQSNLKVLW